MMEIPKRSLTQFQNIESLYSLNGDLYVDFVGRKGGIRIYRETGHVYIHDAEHHDSLTGALTPDAIAYWRFDESQLILAIITEENSTKEILVGTCSKNLNAKVDFGCLPQDWAKKATGVARVSRKKLSLFYYRTPSNSPPYRVDSQKPLVSAQK